MIFTTFHTHTRLHTSIKIIKVVKHSFPVTLHSLPVCAVPPSLKQFFLPSLVIKCHAMLNIHSSCQITFRTSCYAGFTSGLHFSAVPPNLKQFFFRRSLSNVMPCKIYIHHTKLHFILPVTLHSLPVCVFRQCHQV